MFWLSTERAILTKYGSYRGEIFIYLFFDAIAAERAILMQFVSSVVKYNYLVQLMRTTNTNLEFLHNVKEMKKKIASLRM